MFEKKVGILEEWASTLVGELLGAASGKKVALRQQQAQIEAHDKHLLWSRNQALLGIERKE